MSVALNGGRRQGSGLALAMPALLLLILFFVLPVTALLLRSVLEP